MSAQSEPTGAPQGDADPGDPAVPAFCCNACRRACSSALDQQRHEWHIRAHGAQALPLAASTVAEFPGLLDEEAASEQEKTLGEHLDTSGAGNPAVGLQYVVEYWIHAHFPFYVCELCSWHASAFHMFVHVMHHQHRLAYLSKHHPEKCGIWGTNQQIKQQLKELSAEAEAKHGRQQIQIERNSKEVRRKYHGYFAAANKSQRKTVTKPRSAPSMGSASASNPGSASASNPGSASASYPTSGLASATASSVQARSVPVQELQKGHAESRWNKRKGDDFRSNQELIEYLKEFEISCEDDAAFLMKVTESFTRSLLLFRLKSRESRKATVVPQNSYSTQQTNTASSAGKYMYTPYPPQAMSGQQLPVSPTTNDWVDPNRSVMRTKPAYYPA